VRDFVPSRITVERVGIDDSGLGPRVNLYAIWTSESGEKYEVCAQLLTCSASASLVRLLLAGELGPLALEAFNEPC
jgi:hypothetical protein